MWYFPKSYANLLFFQFQNNSINTLFARVGAEDTNLSIHPKGMVNKEINYPIWYGKYQDWRLQYISLGYIKISNLKMLVYNKPEKDLKMSHVAFLITFIFCEYQIGFSLTK